MLAADILKQMADTYATVHTYNDRARMSKVGISRSEQQEDNAQILTYFVRPDQFRLDYRVEPSPNPWPHHSFVIWRDRGDIKIFKRGEIDIVTLERSFVEIALLGHFTSVAILALLMPNALRGDGLLSKIEDPRYQGEDLVDGHQCYRIVGGWGIPAGTKITLWLGINDYLVRRLFQQTHHDLTHEEQEGAVRNARLRAAGIPDELRPPFRKSRKVEDYDTETTITFDPQSNVTIDHANFEFTPQGKSSSDMV